MRKYRCVSASSVGDCIRLTLETTDQREMGNVEAAHRLGDLDLAGIETTPIPTTVVMFLEASTGAWAISNLMCQFTISTDGDELFFTTDGDIVHKAKAMLPSRRVIEQFRSLAS